MSVPPSEPGKSRMLTALLKHHRRARGLSQLDLASAAEVSPKHLSFLETGRAKPSREMVLRIGATLGLSLRDQNSLLQAAGFSESYQETELGSMSPAIRNALERMAAAQEPYPLVVFDGNYELRMFNHACQRLMSLLIAPDVLARQTNMLALCFDPEGVRPHMENWEEVARHLLNRLSREHLQTGREALGLLLSRLLAYPDVPSDFRTLDLSAPIVPVFDVRFRYKGQTLSFLTTVTSFNSPRDVTLEELRIESYFPLDDQTTQLCKALAEVR
jgi:transcriptional regulator with XRE-family HTH domain